MPLQADGLEIVRVGLAHADPDVRRIAGRIRDRFVKLGYPSFGQLTSDTAVRG